MSFWTGVGLLIGYMLTFGRPSSSWKEKVIGIVLLNLVCAWLVL